MELNVKIRVYGLVQGVNFRTSTKSKAEEIGLRGIVKNESDGSVYIEVEGTTDQIEILKDWCRQGPARAKVEKVVVEGESEVKGVRGFEIRRF